MGAFNLFENAKFISLERLHLRLANESSALSKPLLRSLNPSPAQAPYKALVFVGFYWYWQSIRCMS